MQDPKNTIYGERASLSHFLSTLRALEAGSVKTLSVVHIGDSHIRSDYFPSKLRVMLQEKFGNAGRGLIFPYHIVHASEPANYSSSSRGEWNANYRDGGVCGITAVSGSVDSGFSIRTRDQKGMNYAFNRMELFSTRSTNENTHLVHQEQTILAEKKTSSFVSVFNLQQSAHHIDFQFLAPPGVDVQGLVLKNDQTGILYHSIGINGATFKSYNDTNLFMQQLCYLQPDLLIVSLGTNESYGNKLNITEFADQVSLFLESVEDACKSCSILLTTPSDNCKLKKEEPVKNDHPKQIGDYLKQYAAKNRYALWDLYELMGGQGSMMQWVEQGLAEKDYVHFTQKGYELQGNLLGDALIKMSCEHNG